MKKEIVENYLGKIQNARWNTFPAVTKHLFDYLDEFKETNQVIQKYEDSRKKWGNWPDGPSSSFGIQWSLPDNEDDCKTLSYNIYRKIVETNDINEISFQLFRNRKLEDNVYDLNRTFLAHLTGALTDIINDPSVKSKQASDKVGPTEIREGTVFIIHGHDESMKTQVQLLLERAKIKNVILHDRPDRGRTIIEKLEDESEYATYAIALFSPDDEIQKGEHRARQNVILEVGYFIGKLTRAKVRILKKMNIEIPSDLQGVLYETYDMGGAWKMKLIKELEDAGFNPDKENVLKTL